MECATPATRRILIVEDEAFCATTLEIGLLSLNDVEVLLAASVPKALHLLHSFRISMVVTDLNLPTINGFDQIALALRASNRYFANRTGERRSGPWRAGAGLSSGRRCILLQTIFDGAALSKN